ncbi:MAG: RluA family pseudouridine synthase [Alphaproteobacteria bacterium]
MAGVTQVRVTEDEAGMRLDRWFRSHYPGLSQGMVNKLARKGQIRVDGGRVKANSRIEAGQVVRVPPMPDDATQAPVKTESESHEVKLDQRQIEEIKSWVIHDDKHVVVINKPHGLPVQGGSGLKKHLDGMLAALANKSGVAPKLTHRLDKDTSGVLVLARSDAAARHLTRAFRSRETIKDYWALTVGKPEVRAGKIDLPILKGAAGKGERMRVDHENGKRAVTLFAIADSAGSSAAFVCLRPVTGRTHQLRIHLVEAGCPILGDGKYGGPEARLDGAGVQDRKMHLHARRLRIPHPSGNGFLDVTAPPPPYFKRTMKELGLEEGDAELADALIDQMQ